MPRIFGFSLACAALVSLGAPAHSQSVPANVGLPAAAGAYNFFASNASTSVNGIITTDATGHATAISGLVNGTNAITGLSTYAGADNALYGNGAWVTFAGVSFSTTSLGDFNFYNSGLGYYGLLSSRVNINGFPDGQTASLQVRPVPEPATWAMMIVGFALTAIALRRRRVTLKLLPQIA
jgi:hypothetical protein